VAPGWLLYVSMVWLTPAVDPACYTPGAKERSGNQQPGIKLLVKCPGGDERRSSVNRSLTKWLAMIRNMCGTIYAVNARPDVFR
jgi:hypothetical protein